MALGDTLRSYGAKWSVQETEFNVLNVHGESYQPCTLDELSIVNKAKD